MFKKHMKYAFHVVARTALKLTYGYLKIQKIFPGVKPRTGVKLPDSHLQGEGRERKEGRSLGRGRTGKGKRGAVGGRRVREKE